MANDREKLERGETVAADAGDVAADQTVAVEAATATGEATRNVTLAMRETVAGGEAMSTDDTVAAGPVDAASMSDTVVVGGSRQDDMTVLPTRDPARYVRGGEIARGGMGRIVSVRDQELGRTLAIKELLSRNPALERRFEREIRITARLQHPAIIAVHEAGRWPSGEPFYTMKHIEGRALDTVIAERKTLSQRLALLPTIIAVADALAYAHSQGVIHRDLKPANVLVGAYGESVVIDWGLAKHLTDDSEEARVSSHDRASDQGDTVLGEALGTPAYMPPEQAQGKQVDERADVYALGAMLYELLAGAMPYADTEPKSAQELLEKVKDGAPMRLSHIAPDAPTDLVTIVHKAMARRYDERYPTAKELAEDLRRFETGQLVSAHEYSTATLVRRWVGRHRAAVSVAAVMVVALAVGGVVSFSRISRERDRAEESRTEVEDLLGFMLRDLHNKLQPIGQTELLGMVADKAADYYARHPVDWGRDEEVRNRAAAQDNVGRVLQEQGDLDRADDQYRASLATRERLAREDPTNALWQHDLSVSYDRVADVLVAQGNLDGALQNYRASLAIREQLAKKATHNALWQRDLLVSYDRVADVLVAQGDLDGALQNYRASLAIAERLAQDDPNNARSQNDLSLSYSAVGGVLASQGKLDGALQNYRASLAIAERLAKKDPNNARWQHDLAASYDRVGDVHLSQKALDAALEKYRASLTIRARLAEKDPNNARWQRSFAVSYMKVGDVYLAQGVLDTALEHYETALTIRERLAKKDPNNARWQRGLLVSYDRVGHVLRAQGDLDGALQKYRAVLTIAERLAQDDANNAGSQSDLAFCYAGVGDVLRAQGNLDGALQKHRASLAIREQLVRRDPRNARWQSDLAFGYTMVGDVLLDQADLDGALEKHRASVAIRERLSEQDPGNSQWQRDMAAAYVKLGAVLRARGEHTEARDVLSKSADIYAATALVGGDFYNTACAYALTGDADRAFEMLDTAVDRGWHQVAWTEKDPDLVSLHDDPRWKPLIEKLGAEAN